MDTTDNTQTDIVIVGAGPAGLSMAIALEKTDLNITIVDPQPRSTLSAPKIDGREIALNHATKHFLEEHGIWSKFSSEDVHRLNTAQIANGENPYALQFTAPPQSNQPLGFLVSNHIIRKGLIDKALQSKTLTLLDNFAVCAVDSNHASTKVTIQSSKEGGDVQSIFCKLIIAADSRFSQTRRMLGIGAKMKDFGRVMTVCRMRHQIDHKHIARECFKYGKTCAVLPLQDNVCSLVVTVPSSQSYIFSEMNDHSFNSLAQDILKNSLGKMEVISERVSYPLIGTYADSFISSRAALIGDAAVGMHPVTAHGYNLGVSSVTTLAKLITKAQAKKQDIGASWLLHKYQLNHRLEAKLIYEATNAIVALYTNDTVPAKFLRNAALQIGNKLPPFKNQVIRKLMTHNH